MVGEEGGLREGTPPSLFLSLTLPLEEGKERVFFDAKGVDVGQGGVGGGAGISTYRREGKVVFEKEVVL